MDKKHILLSFLLAFIIVVSAGIYFWSTQNQTTGGLQNTVLFSAIKGCAQTEKSVATGMGERALVDETGEEKAPKIEVNGNEIKYSRAINNQCCRTVEIQKEISSSAITIYEYWSGIGCRCICFSEIEAVLKNVPAGTYAVNVYEKGIKPGETELMEPKLIITQNVTIE